MLHHVSHLGARFGAMAATASGGGGVPGVTGPFVIGATAHESDRWIEPNLWGTSATVRYKVAPNTNNGVKGTGADHYIAVWKSLDAGATWAEMDSGNRIPCKFEVNSWNASRNIAPAIFETAGQIIYGLYFVAEVDPSYGFLGIYRFSTATDTWLTPIAGTASQKVPSTLGEEKNPVASPVNGLCASICRRASDGALLIFFNGDSELIGGLYYNRNYYDIYVSGAWLGVLPMPDQAGVTKDYYMWVTLTDSLDIPHFFYLYQTRAAQFAASHIELYHNSLSVGNAVSARQTVAADPDLRIPGTSGGRMAVSGVPIAFAGTIWIPILGSDPAVVPPLNHNPRSAVIAGAEGAAPTWAFVTDVTSGGVVANGSPDDIGPTPDAWSFCLVGLSGVPSLYAVWCTGGSVYYRATTDSGVTWDAVVTLIDSHSGLLPYRWLLEAARVADNCFGITFPQDSEFYWWPIEYMEVCFGSTPPPTALAITGPAPIDGDETVVYSACIGYQGGTGPIIWTATTALPPGLTIDPSSGCITGTPSVGSAGSYVVTVCVTDSTPTTVCATYTIVIHPNTTAWVVPPDSQDGWHVVTGDSGAPAGSNIMCREADGNVSLAELVNTPSLNVTPGDQYYLEAYGRADAGTTGSLSIGLKFYDVNGAFLSEVEVVLSDTPLVFTQFSGTVTVPASAVTASFFVRVTGHTTGRWCWAAALAIRLDSHWELSSIKSVFSDFLRYR